MTPKFEFREPTVVHLGNVNARKEIHGEDLVQAIDLSCKIDLTSSCLDDMFAPGLRKALYFNAAADAGQDDLNDIEASMPNLRFPKLNGQKFNFGGKDKLTGYILNMEYGLGDEISNIELELCKVYGRAFEIKEGGTVTVHFKVSNASNRLDKDTCGKLVLLGGVEVTMSLRAPDAQTVETNTEPQNPFGDDKDPDDIGAGPLFPKTAEELFSETAGGGEAETAAVH